MPLGRNDGRKAATFYIYPAKENITHTQHLLIQVKANQRQLLRRGALDTYTHTRFGIRNAFRTKTVPRRHDMPYGSH
jgi:hypothetical protein